MSQAPAKRQVWWWWVLGGALILAGALGFYQYKKQPKDTTKYREEKVERADLEVTILSTGVVQPQNRLDIKPPTPGRVEQVLAQAGDRVRKGQILAWMSSTERAALLDSARSKGAEELKRWEELYRPTPIMAPISGMIILKNVEPGQTFTNTEAVFVLSDRLTVKAQVDETDIASVKVGQTTRIILDAYAKESIPARVDKIAYDAKTVNNVTTYIVDVLPNETPEFMRSGMTANVTFFVDARKQVLTIPSEALKVIEGNYEVLVPDTENPKAPPRSVPVTIGITDGKRTEILAGLSEGDTVLIVEMSLGNGEKKSSNPFAPFSGPPKKKKG